MAVTLNANSSTGFIATSDTSSILQLQTGGTTAVTVDASQRVGIGTSSPSTWATNLVVYNNQLTVTGGQYDGSFSDAIFFAGNAESTTYRHKISSSISSSTTNSQLKISVASGSSTFVDALTMNGTGAVALSGATKTVSGVGIVFPATQSASSDANTLDDYEEGTWTPSSLTGVNLTGISWSAGNYTKVGRLVTLIGYANCTVTSSNTLTYLATTGAPFTTDIATSGSAFLNNNVKSGTSQISSTSVYVFFPAASAPVAGAEIIQLSITYTV